MYVYHVTTTIRNRTTQNALLWEQSMPLIYIMVLGVFPGDHEKSYILSPTKVDKSYHVQYLVFLHSWMTINFLHIFSGELSNKEICNDKTYLWCSAPDTFPVISGFQLQSWSWTGVKGRAGEVWGSRLCLHAGVVPQSPICNTPIWLALIFACSSYVFGHSPQ